MRWDIFCKVIDNHGDLGVCWRLSSQLALRGASVRLWVDDASALRWMAPEGCAGVELVDWRDPMAVRTAAGGPPPDVLIEAFGCDPAPEALARFAEAAHRGGPKRHWLNLEYLSAEPSVERLHGLPSSVFQGPGAGLTKHFFYPGFTRGTGGLLREPDVLARQAAFDRAAWLASRGIRWQGERVVSLFSYEPAALEALLVQLARANEPTRLLVTAGRAAGAVRAVQAGSEAFGRHGALSIDFLPHLPQTDFDHLLWASDLNLVRGEDSLVRALWAGAPMVWQIYPQHDDAHHAKLEAFQNWFRAPPTLAAFQRRWNGFGPTDLPVLDAATLADWRRATVAARAQLLGEDDLLTRLDRFLLQKS